MQSRRSWILSAFAATAAAKKFETRKVAPEFSLPDRNGRETRLADYRGKVVLLDFWATWCVPCRTEIPMFMDLAKQYRGEGFEIVGVAMDEGGWGAVNPFVDEMKVNYPVLLGNKRVGYLYGDIDALPVTFLIDRQGRVAHIQLGPAGKRTFEREIRELLAERQAAARRPADFEN